MDWRSMSDEEKLRMAEEVRAALCARTPEEAQERLRRLRGEREERPSPNRKRQGV